MEKKVVFEDGETVLEIQGSKSENSICVDVSILSDDGSRAFWITTPEDYLKIRTEMDRIACELWADLKGEL